MSTRYLPLLHALCASLLVSCNISYEVLTLARDDAGGVTTLPPTPQCDCGEQEICVASSCLTLPVVSTIAAGDRHTCRVYQGQLWCWGDNSSNQLGLNNDAPDLVPSPERVGSRTDWLTVAAGSRHTCALRAPGVLRCWGDDSQGQLGSSSARMREQPRVPWDDFIGLKCGGDNCCALRSGGALYCWGSNREGNVGIGRDDNMAVIAPTPVSGDQTFLRAFSVGNTHSCAVATDRTLWCWGNNALHVLGVPDPGKVLAPKQVGEDHDWLWVAAGETQTCGVRKGNVLYCWGDNTEGQVGIARIGPDGEPVVTETPVIVTMSNDWVRVAAGDRHTCAIKREQPTFCWGRSADGRLGLKDVDPVVETPTKVFDTMRFRELTLGAAHSCGLDASPIPTVYCWGANDRGQLGIGNTESRTVAAKVPL
ncbi:MAG TPA: hypothetical protein VFN67_37700 [Polyangiales bacterium]|nr:hypothetical protein [Polyangiales bacterium]